MCHINNPPALQRVTPHHHTHPPQSPSAECCAAFVDGPCTWKNPLLTPLQHDVPLTDELAEALTPEKDDGGADPGGIVATGPTAAAGERQAVLLRIAKVSAGRAPEVRLMR